MTVYIKGLWHQGLVAAGVWSSMGIKVVGLCDSKEEVDRLQSGELPIFEPGLNDLIQLGTEVGNLEFQTLNSNLRTPQILAIMHDTEVDENDNVTTEKIFQDVEDLIYVIAPETEILVTAQVPAGTTSLISKLIREKSGYTPRLSYMPENLRLGQGIVRFETPKLPVIGISNTDSPRLLAKLFDPGVEIQFCEIIEAEILKSALNGFLALSITYGNEISEICDSFQVNGTRVMKLLQLEERVGHKIPILPGLPFSGGTLGRDVQNLRRMTNVKDGVIEGIWNSNHARKEYLIQFIMGVLGKYDEDGIGLIGLTYKTGTNTLRRSFAIDVAQNLDGKDINVYGFDPMFRDFDVPVHPSIRLQESLKSLVNKCSILVIMTPWEQVVSELKTLPLQNHIIIDPFGIFVEEHSRFKGYSHFGGGKFL